LRIERGRVGKIGCDQLNSSEAETRVQMTEGAGKSIKGDENAAKACVRKGKRRASRFPKGEKKRTVNSNSKLPGSHRRGREKNLVADGGKP